MNCRALLVITTILAAVFVSAAQARIRHPPFRPKNPLPDPEEIHPNRVLPTSDGQNNQTIWDILCSNPDLRLAKKALQNAGFKSLLSSLEPTLTLFAPDNKAFNRLAKDVRDYLDNETHREILTGVGLNHLVPGHISSSQFEDQMPMTSLTGIPLRVLVRPLVDSTTIVSVNQATIVAKDLNAANGVIHTTDSVLIPNKFAITTSSDDAKNTTIGRLLSEHKHLSIFYNSLKEADLLDMLDDQSNEFTIFAPSNHAWHGAYLKLLDGSHDSKLNDVLKYHIVPKQRLYSINFGDNASVATYEGKSIRATRNRFMSKDMDRLFVDNAEIIKINLIGRNGVIHTIDRVLLPQK